jgi:hypothetical protein
LLLYGQKSARLDFFSLTLSLIDKIFYTKYYSKRKLICKVIIQKNIVNCQKNKTAIFKKKRNCYLKKNQSQKAKNNQKCKQKFTNSVVFLDF